jgi:hypothetical protein
VESALHSFLISIPQAAAIWITMLLAVAVAVAATVLARPGRLAAAPADSTIDDAARYADEVAVAAERAAAMAARQRAAWEAAREQVDAAWAAYEDADRAARRTASATAFPVLARRRRPGENAERERYLHRAATAACRRREISIKQLNEALAHRGWNPRLHPVVQESALCNAIREHRLAAYRAATAHEQQAWHAAEAAAAALGSLRAEALAARLRTDRPAGVPWWSEQWATTQPLPIVTVPSTVDGRHPIAA